MKLYSLSKLLSGSLILFSLTKRNDETTTTELNKTGYQYSSCLLEGFISFYFPSWSWVTSRGRSWVTNGSDDANIQKDDHDAHVSSLCLFPCTFLSLFPSFLRQEEEFLFNNPLPLTVFYDSHLILVCMILSGLFFAQLDCSVWLRPLVWHAIRC